MMHETYIERGQGPAIVFSHGTLMDATMFDPQLDYLSSRYRAIAYNSRAIIGPNNLHTVDDLVEDCRDFLDRLEINKCVLVGMSVGGFMGIPFALKYQDRLDGLILIDARADAYTQNELDVFGAKFKEVNIDGMLPRDFAEWAAPYCFGETTYARNKALPDYWMERWTKTIPARAVYHQGMASMTMSELTDQLPNITIPVLVVHGEEDLAIPITHALPMVEALPSVTFARISDAGHTPNLENPVVVNDAIGEFLATIYACTLKKR
jgi:pimeloyl-ACP methyl ester carboxylesterase